MLYDSFLRSGYFLRKNKHILPFFLILSMILALALTKVSHIIPSSSILTILCLFIAMLSMIIRWLSLRTPAERMPELILSKGIYSIVRHPIYISNFLMVLSMSLYLGILWYTVMTSFLSVLITERIVYQKENCQYNKYGDDFTLWAKTTGAVVPYVLNWQSPVGSREYQFTARRMSPFVLVSVGSFLGISIVKHRILEGYFNLPIAWTVAFVVALITFIVFYNKQLRLRKEKATK